MSNMDPKNHESSNYSLPEEKHTAPSSLPSDDAPLLDKRKTINYTGDDGMYVKYTTADVILPKQIEMAERKAVFNAMKNVLDNKISTSDRPTPSTRGNQQSVYPIPTTSQKNARTRTLALRLNPTNHHQPMDDPAKDYDNSDYNNNGNNNVIGMITNMKDIEKLKNEVYQFKLTTETLENDMMSEMNTKIDEHRKEIARITDNTNLSQSDKNSLVASLESNIVEVRKYYQMRINEIRSDLEQKQKELRKIQNPKGINWDSGNIATLDTWIKECNKQQFVYDSVLDKIISRSKTIKIVMLILCAVQLLINTSNLGLTDNNSNYYLVLGIKIVVSVISALSYVLTQYVSLEKFEEDIKKYTSYTETLGNFMSDMVSIADIKLELRPDGDKFIVDNKDVYSNIYRTSPYIKQRYWIDSIKDYNNYLDNLDAGGNDYRARKRRLYNRYAALDRAQCYKGICANTKNSVVLNIDHSDHPHDQ